MKKPVLMALVPAAAAVAIAGCGGGGAHSYYAGDTTPGDTTGQALSQFGAKWYVVAGNGNKIDTHGR
jgi:hypothetical protein